MIDTASGAPPDMARAVETIRGELRGLKPRVAIVLGSGLGALARTVDDARTIPYAGIPGFPTTTVVGHGGELIAGRIGSTPVVLQSGRFHLYEGHHPATVVLPVRTFAALGAEVLIVTNAAGGIRPAFRPPALMLIADQLNLMFRNPLVGPVVPPEGRFPDMSVPYDAALRGEARRAALALGITLHEGVYAAVLGPNYETPAEIRMLERLGADAVGMSTVPEVVVARASGMRVLGISTITNLAAGIEPTKLDHGEVLVAGREVASSLERLVRRILENLDEVGAGDDGG